MVTGAMSLPLTPLVTLEGISRLKRPNITSVFVTGDGWTTAVAGIACVSEMKISGVVVGGLIRTGVSAIVGTVLVGAIFTDTSHANITITSMDRRADSGSHTFNRQCIAYKKTWLNYEMSESGRLRRWNFQSPTSSVQKQANSGFWGILIRTG